MFTGQISNDASGKLYISDKTVSDAVLADRQTNILNFMIKSTDLVEDPFDLSLPSGSRDVVFKNTVSLDGAFVSQHQLLTSKYVLNPLNPGTEINPDNFAPSDFAGLPNTVEKTVGFDESSIPIMSSDITILIEQNVGPFKDINDGRWDLTFDGGNNAANADLSIALNSRNAWTGSEGSSGVSVNEYSDFNRNYALAGIGAQVDAISAVPLAFDPTRANTFDKFFPFLPDSKTGKIEVDTLPSENQLASSNLSISLPQTIATTEEAEGLVGTYKIYTTDDLISVMSEYANEDPVDPSDTLLDMPLADASTLVPSDLPSSITLDKFGDMVFGHRVTDNWRFNIEVPESQGAAYSIPTDLEISVDESNVIGNAAYIESGKVVLKHQLVIQNGSTELLADTAFANDDNLNVMQLVGAGEKVSKGYFDRVVPDHADGYVNLDTRTNSTRSSVISSNIPVPSLPQMRVIYDDSETGGLTSSSVIADYQRESADLSYKFDFLFKNTLSDPAATLTSTSAAGGTPGLALYANPADASNISSLSFKSNLDSETAALFMRLSPPKSAFADGYLYEGSGEPLVQALNCVVDLKISDNDINNVIFEDYRLLLEAKHPDSLFSDLDVSMVSLHAGATGADLWLTSSEENILGQNTFPSSLTAGEIILEDINPTNWRDDHLVTMTVSSVGSAPSFSFLGDIVTFSYKNINETTFQGYVPKASIIRQPDVSFNPVGSTSIVYESQAPAIPVQAGASDYRFFKVTQVENYTITVEVPYGAYKNLYATTDELTSTVVHYVGYRATANVTVSNGALVNPTDAFPISNSTVLKYVRLPATESIVRTSTGLPWSTSFHITKQSLCPFSSLFQTRTSLSANWETLPSAPVVQEDVYYGNTGSYSVDPSNPERMKITSNINSTFSGRETFLELSLEYYNIPLAQSVNVPSTLSAYKYDNLTDPTDSSGVEIDWLNRASSLPTNGEEITTYIMQQIYTRDPVSQSITSTRYDIYDDVTLIASTTVGTSFLRNPVYYAYVPNQLLKLTESSTANGDHSVIFPLVGGQPWNSVHPSFAPGIAISSGYVWAQGETATYKVLSDRINVSLIGPITSSLTDITDLQYDSLAQGKETYSLVLTKYRGYSIPKVGATLPYTQGFLIERIKGSMTFQIVDANNSPVISNKMDMTAGDDVSEPYLELNFASAYSLSPEGDRTDIIQVNPSPVIISYGNDNKINDWSSKTDIDADASGNIIESMSTYSLFDEFNGFLKIVSRKIFATRGYSYKLIYRSGNLHIDGSRYVFGDPLLLQPSDFTSLVDCFWVDRLIYNTFDNNQLLPNEGGQLKLNINEFSALTGTMYFVIAPPHIQISQLSLNGAKNIPYDTANSSEFDVNEFYRISVPALSLVSPAYYSPFSGNQTWNNLRIEDTIPKGWYSYASTPNSTVCSFKPSSYVTITDNVTLNTARTTGRILISDLYNSTTIPDGSFKPNEGTLDPVSRVVNFKYAQDLRNVTDLLNAKKNMVLNFGFEVLPPAIINLTALPFEGNQITVYNTRLVKTQENAPLPVIQIEKREMNVVNYALVGSFPNVGSISLTPHKVYKSVIPLPAYPLTHGSNNSYYKDLLLSLANVDSTQLVWIESLDEFDAYMSLYPQMYGPGFNELSDTLITTPDYPNKSTLIFARWPLRISNGWGLPMCYTSYTGKAHCPETITFKISLVESYTVTANAPRDVTLGRDLYMTTLTDKPNVNWYQFYPRTMLSTSPLTILGAKRDKQFDPVSPQHDVIGGYAVIAGTAGAANSFIYNGYASSASVQNNSLIEITPAIVSGKLSPSPSISFVQLRDIEKLSNNTVQGVGTYFSEGNQHGLWYKIVGGFNSSGALVNSMSGVTMHSIALPSILPLVPDNNAIGNTTLNGISNGLALANYDYLSSANTPASSTVARSDGDIGGFSCIIDLETSNVYPLINIHQVVSEPFDHPLVAHKLIHNGGSMYTIVGAYSNNSPLSNLNGTGTNYATSGFIADWNASTQIITQFVRLSYPFGGPVDLIPTVITGIDCSSPGEPYTLSANYFAPDAFGIPRWMPVVARIGREANNSFAVSSATWLDLESYPENSSIFIHDIIGVSALGGTVVSGQQLAIIGDTRL
jgi:hypothetical protein